MSTRRGTHEPPPSNCSSAKRDGNHDGMNRGPRGLPLDRFLGRLVGPPLLARKASSSTASTSRLPRPTSCAFGGARLDQLFITSASIGLGEEERAMQPNAGGLFAVSPGVAGIADVPFKG
jgi:hypothetical protein